MARTHFTLFAFFFICCGPIQPKHIHTQTHKHSSTQTHIRKLQIATNVASKLKHVYIVIWMKSNILLIFFVKLFTVTRRHFSSRSGMPKAICTTTRKRKRRRSRRKRNNLSNCCERSLASAFPWKSFHSESLLSNRIYQIGGGGALIVLFDLHVFCILAFSFQWMHVHVMFAVRNVSSIKLVWSSSKLKTGLKYVKNLFIT